MVIGIGLPTYFGPSRQTQAIELKEFVKPVGSQNEEKKGIKAKVLSQNHTDKVKEQAPKIGLSGA